MNEEKRTIVAEEITPPVSDINNVASEQDKRYGVDSSFAALQDTCVQNYV